jgi:alpha-tubulin suppressor-like RCC1 family protein
VLADGSARCWGWNDGGQLGDGTLTSRPTPAPVAGLAGVVAIAGGGFHSCAITATGSVACWGANESGQIGTGRTTAQEPLPMAVSPPAAPAR